MTKIGTPLVSTYEDSGFDEFMARPFEGLGTAPREWEESQGYEDLVAHLDDSVIHAQRFAEVIVSTSEGIQVAIDYANNLGGGTVRIRNGTYIISTDIILYSNIALIGEDQDNTIIDFNATDYQIKCVGTSGTHKSNISIKNIQMRGRRATSSILGSMGALRLLFTDNVSIEKCYFTDNWDGLSSVGLDIEIGDNGNTHRSYFINECQFVDSGDGLLMLPTSDSLVSGCSFRGCLGTAIQAGVGQDFRILGNSFSDCEGAIFRNGYHADRSDLYYMSFTNNVIVDHKSDGIVGGSINYCTFTGNVFRGTTGSGDAFKGGSSFNANVISGNVITNFDGDGIDINTGDENVITGNNIQDNGAYGVTLISGSNNNAVVGNVIRNNTSGATNDAGTGNVITNNST